MNPPGILVRVPNWIGDAVMAAPAIQALASVRPAPRIGLQAVERVWPLFEAFAPPFELLPPLPNRIRGSEMWRQASHLRGYGFSAALILPPSASSRMLPRLAGIPRQTGWPSSGASRTRSLRDQYRELATEFARRHLGSASMPEGPVRLPLRAAEIEWARSWWEAKGLDPTQTLLLAPGATFGPTKRWPAERWLELGASLLREGWNLLWSGGPDERALAVDLESAARLRAGSNGTSFALAGEVDLRQALAVQASVRGVISNDSGAMHLAQAAGAPVVAIFGSTSPVWTGPVGEDQRVVYAGVHCSPCFRSTCPTKIECLGDIDSAWVRRTLLDLLGPRDEPRPRAGLRPALFLDRDGTLLEPVPYLTDPRDVVLVPGAASALARFQEAGFALVVVTNQSAMARGWLDADGLAAVHDRMESLLALEGVHLDAVEVCPHHPEFSPPCLCRKPAPGLILQAAHHRALDLERSLLVGDARSDLDAAAAAGVRGVLVRTGYGRDVEAERWDGPVFDSLADVPALLASS